MELTQETRQNLNEIRKWAYFLSILGFIGIGLMLIGSISIGTIFNHIGDNDLPFPGSLLGGVYFILAVIYFFPVYYLFKFSTHMKQALLNNEETDEVLAFRFLKSHYKYIGIFAVVMLSIYVLAILIGVLVGFAI